jgi:hypothetical protein
MSSLLKTVTLAAMVVGAASAMAQSYPCAQALQAQALKDATAEASALSVEFKDAFNQLPLDKATSNISTIGATMVGHAMSNEVCATIDGLRNLVSLRDQFPVAGGRETVLAQLNLAMREASNRMRKVSIAYGQVSRMAAVKEVQDLAGNGLAFADGLSKQWTCQP